MADSSLAAFDASVTKLVIHSVTTLWLICHCLPFINTLRSWVNRDCIYNYGYNSHSDDSEGWEDSIDDGSDGELDEMNVDTDNMDREILVSTQVSTRSCKKILFRFLAVFNDTDLSR